MKNLKDILRKPVVLCSIIGALGLGIGTLALKNIGLKNQNDDLFNKYIEMSKIYPNLVSKYGQLIEDSMKISSQHSSEIISLIGDKLKLAYSFDSLQKSYVTSAENLVEFLSKFSFEMDSLQKGYSEAYEEFFNKILLIKDENDFYKKHLHFLDSLLFKCESDKMFQDKK